MDDFTYVKSSKLLRLISFVLTENNQDGQSQMPMSGHGKIKALPHQKTANMNTMSNNDCEALSCALFRSVPVGGDINICSAQLLQLL